MNYQTLRSITGVIQNIGNGTSCCSQQVSLLTSNGPVNFILTGDTIVIDNIRLRRGMRVTAFYDSALPVPAIFPPQYQTVLITVVRENQFVMLNFFDRTLTAEDQSLRLNIGPMTSISTLNGQNFPCRPVNSLLLVYYTATTFSIPPQTTPQRIIVLCPGS